MMSYDTNPTPAEITEQISGVQISQNEKQKVQCKIPADDLDEAEILKDNTAVQKSSVNSVDKTEEDVRYLIPALVNLLMLFSVKQAANARDAMESASRMM